MGDLVCLRTFIDETQAEMVRGFLEVQGIEASIAPDAASGAMYHLGGLRIGGAKLLVKAEDAEKAKTVLKDFEEKP